MGFLRYLFELIFFAAPMAVGATLVARWLTQRSIVWAEKHRMVAEVDERSSHEAPMPRVGGVGLIGGVLLGFVLLAMMLAAREILPEIVQPPADALGWLPLAGWFGAVVLAFGLGFWDDRHNVPAVAKLIGQIAIAFVAPLCGLRLTQIHLPGMESPAELAPAAGVVLTAFWVLLMMNAVNFMDGINGLAGRFAQFAAVAVLVAPLNFTGWQTLIPLCAALWGSSEGFLAFNLREAKTFMGDCGSQPLGVMIALLGVHVATLPAIFPLPFLGVLIIVSPFVYDVVYTLVQRAMRGQNLLKAHREHLYQRYLIATGEDHTRTRLFVESHLMTAAIIGALYIRFYYDPSKTEGQIVLILAAAVSLGIYTFRVRTAEKARPQEA